MNYEIVKFLGNGNYGATYEAISTVNKTRTGIRTGIGAEIGGERGIARNDVRNNDDRVAIKFIFPISGQKDYGLNEVQSYVKVAGTANNEDMSSPSCQFNLLCFHTAGEITNSDGDYVTIFNMLEDVNVNKQLGHKLDPNASIVYIVTDFLDGDDLSVIISNNNQRNIGPSEQTLGEFLSDILTALQYLHSKGISHRDIKPANIIRTRDGRFVLIDFGLVCHKPRCDAAGSPLYMSNELHMLGLSNTNFPLPMTAAADFFALAISFFEYATGDSFEYMAKFNNYGLYAVTSLPKLRLESEGLQRVYTKLLYDYNYISLIPDAIPQLLAQF